MQYGKTVWIFPDAELPPEGADLIPGHAGHPSGRSLPILKYAPRPPRTRKRGAAFSHRKGFRAVLEEPRKKCMPAAGFVRPSGRPPDGAARAEGKMSAGTAKCFSKKRARTGTLELRRGRGAPRSNGPSIGRQEIMKEETDPCGGWRTF